MPAKKASRFMNAKQLPAPGTSPLFFFGSDEISYAQFLYVPEVFHHAHSVPGSVAFVQVIEHGAGKAVAIGAVAGLAVHYLLTGFNTARDPGFWFGTVVAPATGACISVPQVRTAQPAVHPAGGDQRPANSLRPGRSSLHHAAPKETRASTGQCSSIPLGYRSATRFGLTLCSRNALRPAGIRDTGQLCVCIRLSTKIGFLARIFRALDLSGIANTDMRCFQSDPSPPLSSP